MNNSRIYNCQHMCPISADCLFASDCVTRGFNESRKILKFHKGDIISSDYEQERSIYIIVSGIGISNYYLESGEEITMCLMGKGQTFGEGFPFNGDFSISLHALTDITVCKLSADYLLNGGSETLNNVILAGLNNYRAFARQVWIMNAQRIYERIKRILIVLTKLNDWENNKVPLIISHADLALLINTDRPSVTRTLHKLEEEGFVELGYQQVEIINPVTACTMEDVFQTNLSREFFEEPCR